MDEVERIASQIDLTYRDGFWGGGSIRDLFRSLTALEAASYPISGAHSAWEIALHIAVWHNIFRSRTVYEMLHGISQHDHYHAGQVMMLKKAILAASVK